MAHIDNTTSIDAAADGRGCGLVAFVLGSGSSLGAVQVGMLRALIEHGVLPDMVLGSSVGAINGALLAENPTLRGVARLHELWRTLAVTDLLPRRRIPPIAAFVRRREAIYPNDRLRRYLERVLTATTFEQLEVPFQCVATDTLDGSETWFDQGPLVDVVLASSSPPAVLPSVKIGERQYLDGGIVNDVPVRRAADLGARRLYVLEVGRLSQAWSQPTRPLESALRATQIVRRHRFLRDLDDLPDDVEVHLMPDGEPPPMRFSDLSRGPELMWRAYHASKQYLQRPLEGSGRSGVAHLGVSS